MTSRIGFAVVLFVLLSADLPSQQRKTDDLGNDLLTTLIQNNRLDEAKWVCQSEISRTSEGQIGRARWTCRLADVFAEQQSATIFSASTDDLVSQVDHAIAISTEPIDQIRGLEAKSSLNLFLDAAKTGIRRDLLRSAIIAASVAPTSQERTSELISRVARLQSDTQEVLDRARDRWSQSTTEGNKSSRDDDRLGQSQLKRLVGELVLQRVSIALLQTELFPPASNDFRAAAAECIRLAEEAVLEFSDATAAKQIARSMLADAFLRSGDHRSAKILIDQTIGTQDAGNLFRMACVESATVACRREFF